EPADVVTLETAHGLAANAEHRERLRRARVDVPARKDRDGGQTRESVPVDVDVVATAPPGARRGEGREVRHRRAGREDAAPLGRQVEELLQPVEGELLAPRADR